MEIGTTAVILSEVQDKTDHKASNQAVEKIKLPVSIAKEFQEICLAIIVRNDNFYPEEHYRIGNVLVTALQFDPEKVLSLSTETITQMICEKFAAYLSTISVAKIEEREYTMMVE